jgi:hypothetical protein
MEQIDLATIGSLLFLLFPLNTCITAVTFMYRLSSSNGEICRLKRDARCQHETVRKETTLMYLNIP